MCGRFYIASEDTEEELRAIIESIQRNSELPVKTGEIRPTDVAPVIANSRKLIPTPFAMKWGYSIANGRPVINARSETAMDKAMFRDGMIQRRCLIPATHYFEWEPIGKQKIKNAIKPKGANMMYMAGIYRLEQDRAVFTILTREPGECIRHIHDRMPVILPREACGDWLNHSYEARDVLRAALTEMDYISETGHFVM